MTDTPSNPAEAFLTQLATPISKGEAGSSMAEKREAAADAREDALDKALEDSGAFDDLDGEDEPEERPAKKADPKARAAAAEKKAKGEEPEGDDEDEDDEGELEKLPDEDDDLEDSAEEDAEEPDEDEEEDAEDTDLEAALDRATEKLRAAKVPMSVIRKTARETLIAWAASMDDDGGDAESAPREKPGAGKARDDTTTAAESDDSSSVDWKSVSAGLAEELGIDPERAERAFKPLVSVVEKALAERLAKVESFHQQALEDRGRERIESNVRRLSEDFPQLKTNPRLSEALKRKAITLARGYQAGGDKMPSADALFDEAAKLVLGPAKASRDLASKRRNGVSRSPDRVGTRSTENGTMGSWFDEQMSLVEGGKVDRAMRNRPPPGAKDRSRF